MAKLNKASEGAKSVSRFANISTPKGLQSQSFILLDFETKAIMNRPQHYPPKPVGVALKFPKEKKGKYYAWGHPTGNNCTVAEGKAIVASVFAGGTPILMHHAKFDCEVAADFIDKDIFYTARNIHDTLILLYLLNPHAKNLSLKPSAEALLGIPATERDAVRDWLIANGVVSKNNTKGWGAFISEAPGDLVGKYACSDINMTGGLWDYACGRVFNAGMREAYYRELGLIAPMVDNERRGVRADVKGLRAYESEADADIAKLEGWLSKKLKVGKGFNFDSADDLADALTSSKVVTQWDVTAGGKRSTAKSSMTVDKFKDKKVYTALAHRSRVSYGLSHFVRPWLAQAKITGCVHTTWDLVRSPDVGGTRTGRVSSSNPNLANVSKSLEDKGDGYQYDSFLQFTAGVKPLALMRKFILPDQKGVWVHRDYSQQELRVLADYADGALMRTLIDQPEADVHELVKEMIHDRYGILLTRRQVKDINFGIIYGLGIPGLAARLDLPVDSTKELRRAHAEALPDVANFDKETKRIGKMGEPVRTLGGRVYYAEEPAFSKKFGRVMDFAYKLVNYRVQGGSADITKQALLNYHNHPERSGRFLVTVYDEINVSAGSNKKQIANEARILRDCMLEAGEMLGCRVPMLSSCKTGPTWGDLKAYAEK